jgi:hypothetical protein
MAGLESPAIGEGKELMSLSNQRNDYNLTE